MVQRGYSEKGRIYLECCLKCKSLLALKMYAFLIGSVKLGGRNSVTIKMKVLAEKFNVGSGTVSKAVSELKRIGLVRKIRGGVMINPHAEIKEYHKFHKEVFALWKKLQ